MDLRKIRTLLQLMNENGLAEMELEEDGMKIKFSKGVSGIPQMMAAPMGAAAMPVFAPVELGAAEAGSVTEESEGDVITSPMPGTFYAAPSPDQPSFVSVGDIVDAETVICIVEAMKVMNEIKAECSGKIVEVLAQNGDPVEFGKPLFRIV